MAPVTSKAKPTRWIGQCFLPPGESSSVSHTKEDGILILNLHARGEGFAVLKLKFHFCYLCFLASPKIHYPLLPLFYFNITCDLCSAYKSARHITQLTIGIDEHYERNYNALGIFFIIRYTVYTDIHIYCH